MTSPACSSARNGVYRFATVTRDCPAICGQRLEGRGRLGLQRGRLSQCGSSGGAQGGNPEVRPRASTSSGPMVSRHVRGDSTVSSGYSQLGDGPEAKIQDDDLRPHQRHVLGLERRCVRPGVGRGQVARRRRLCGPPEGHHAVHQDGPRHHEQRRPVRRQSQGGDLPWLAPGRVHWRCIQPARAGDAGCPVPDIRAQPAPRPPGNPFSNLRLDTSSSTSRASGRARLSASPMPSSGLKHGRQLRG